MLKHLMVLAVLTAVMQAAPPIPRQTADHPAAASSNIKSQDQSHNNPTAPALPVADANQPPAAKRDTGRQGDKDAQNSVVVRELPSVTVNTHRDWADWAYFLFSALLAVVGGLQVWLLWKTLGAVKRQADQMEVQTKSLKDSVAAARTSANAAEISANAAMGAAVPTLMLTKFYFTEYTGGGIGAVRFFTRPQVLIEAKNFGLSPAFIKACTIVFTCNELPDEPDYRSRYICDAEDVIGAGETYSPDSGASTLMAPMPDADIEALVARKKQLTVYGYISYGDVFGSPIRYMKFCKRLVEFEFRKGDYVAETGGYLSDTMASDWGGYKYTGQHENYDGSGQQQRAQNPT
jgi:hypothetical protein